MRIKRGGGEMKMKKMKQAERVDEEEAYRKKMCKEKE